MMYRRKNVEWVTEDLSSRERHVMVGYIIHELRSRVGRKHAIRAAGLAKILRNDHEEHTTTPRVRKMVNYIRLQGLLPDVIEGVTGYYIAMDGAELKRYVASLNNHADSIRAVTRSMTKHTSLGGIQQQWT